MTDIYAHTEELLKVFRSDLPSDSETAAAMDRNAPWTEIAQCAEQEGLHAISSALFEAEQQRLEDRPLETEGVDIESSTGELLERYRRHLPATSPTAAAIARGAPWAEIAQQAESEGLHKIAGALFEAEKLKLSETL